MAKLKLLPEDAAIDLVLAVAPRGPIWDRLMAGVAGLFGGLEVEAVRFLNRLVALMRETVPATANELLAEWEACYGLPQCGDAPTTISGRQAALAGRVAAQGGQSRLYFLDVIWAVLESDGEYDRDLEPDLVTITKRPFGSPFVAWGSTAWEAANPGGAAYYWQATLPPDLSAEKLAVIGCLLCTYKPAHSVVVDEAGERFCEGV